ncbi:glycosyl hydrolase [Sinorhizobium fredii USDA 205]|uniref:Glycosyltransferase n=1 Tax=Rhizobium fredii TaxID=380 RepID=A0A844AEF8_RHIFR|nr:glycosyltransferase family A protein [Sinorhizobium fredii]ASY72464.1 Glycosyl transferase, group 2 family protein [Sinorhizobium fredii CCBAU 83666]KSV91992.1 glycosyl hydrolase [Sinorhizobium fredii USDA 205]MQX11574.1 glycosyltransferase [Sinorhizobium fredii]GEC35606.1 glycosyl hydrolase [Sinorhizobium fredii]GLS07434.1 glycosyl hydrolase [Sinorhizobium fredii]
MASVDIVIPCYQHGHFLRDCVDSVLGQQVNDLRILIIDNASTDSSPQVARELAARHKRIEIVLRARNLGHHASFNEGVDWAKADYFMVLCSDDLLAPGSLARMVSVMEQHPQTSFAYGADVHWHEGEPFPGQSDVSPPAPWRVRDGTDFIVERCRNPEAYIAAGMVLARTSAHKAAGHYRTDLPHTDDFEMLLRLARLGSVAHTPAVLGVKRMHSQNRTHDFLAERTRDLVERVAALDSFFSREGHAMADADRLLRLGRRSIAERAYWCGVKDLTRGRASAIALFRLAVRLDPRVALIPPFRYLFRMDRSLLETVCGMHQTVHPSTKS